MKAIRLNREKEIEIIFTICLVLILVWLFTGQQHSYYIYAALGLGAVGLLFPSLTSKLASAWMKFGELMGGVMGKLILSLVFFLFLVPIAFVARLFGNKGSSLQLNKTNSESYYRVRNHKYEPRDLENTW